MNQIEGVCALTRKVRVMILDDHQSTVDGFELPKKKIELEDLLSARHFGLAGMFGRAELIDADIRLTSVPGTGTQIRLSWSGEGIPPTSIADSASSQAAG